MDSERIWNEFSTNIYCFIRKRVHHDEDAQDLLQETFLKIHKSNHQLRDIQKLLPWLYQITRNVLYDFYQNQAKQNSIYPQLALEIGEKTEEDQEELHCCLRPFIQELPEPYRTTMILSELEGIKHKHLAGQLNVSHSAIKSRVKRGREHLKKRFLQCCRFSLDDKGLLSGENQCQKCPS